MRTQWLDAARLSFKGRVFAAVCSLDVRDFEKQPNGDDTRKRQKAIGSMSKETTTWKFLTSF